MRNRRKSRKFTVDHQTKKVTMQKSQLAPISDEITVYGAQKFRKPITKDEFSGTKGSPQEAVVLDIDGTLTDWGHSGNAAALAFAKKHVQAGRVLLVVTARDHEYSLTSSFNHLLTLLPHAFIGPFCRSLDDPRYASEFKRELVQGFEDMGLYRIMGAADDNNFVNDMWKQWAKDHFDNPEDFDLLECGYTSYTSWREALPRRIGKVTSSTTTSKATPATLPKVPARVSVTTPSSRRVWVNGKFVNSEWVTGYWEDQKPPATLAEDAAELSWSEYIETRPGEHLNWSNDGYTLDRDEVIDMVAKEYPMLSYSELQAMDNDKLWRLAGQDYRQDLMDGVKEKFVDGKGEAVFGDSDLYILEDQELEDLLSPEMNLPQAQMFVDDLWEYANHSPLESAESTAEQIREAQEAEEEKVSS